MCNKIISKLFHRLIAAYNYFSTRSLSLKYFWSNFRTSSVAEIILLQFYRRGSCEIKHWNDFKISEWLYYTCNHDFSKEISRHKVLTNTRTDNSKNITPSPPQWRTHKINVIYKAYCDRVQSIKPPATSAVGDQYSVHSRPSKLALFSARRTHGLNYWLAAAGQFEEPIIAFTQGLVEGFFGYVSPKPERTCMKTRM